MNNHEAIKRVLVLSKHKILRCAVELCLARDFDVVMHGNTQMSLENIGPFGPDVIVMDVDYINMMNGHSTAKLLHDLHPTVGAIFLMNVGNDNDSDYSTAALATEENFTLDGMQGTLNGVRDAIGDMTSEEPAYIVFGYRLNVHTETKELAHTA
jgi:CheY-like chemotaxis protein